jgi:catechol 2,3-dioxygenase-like lactoylglutathione lyase family enzyme
VTSATPLARNGVASALAICLALPTGLALPSGCMALSPQLEPTDMAALEQLEDRDAREKAYADSAIYRHQQAQGVRYTKGTSQTAERRSWQSLDVILRSDASSSEALPRRKLRIARVFTALGIAASILTVAGISASAREGLDLKKVDGTSALLLGGGLATVAFAITAGIVYSRAKRDYDRAVDIYNDSLGVRLGLYTPDGKFIAPRGALLDKDGYILLDEPEAGVEEGPQQPGPTPPPEEVAPPVDDTAPPADTSAPVDPAAPPEPAPSDTVVPTPGAGSVGVGLLQMRR